MQRCCEQQTKDQNGEKNRITKLKQRHARNGTTEDTMWQVRHDRKTRKQTKAHGEQRTKAHWHSKTRDDTGSKQRQRTGDSSHKTRGLGRKTREHSQRGAQEEHLQKLRIRTSKTQHKSPKTLTDIYGQRQLLLPWGDIHQYDRPTCCIFVKVVLSRGNNGLRSGKVMMKMNYPK